MIENRVAVVTGATRGIGYGIAKQLTSEGYAVAILGTLDEINVKPQLDILRESGLPILYFKGNLKSSDAREAFVKCIMKKYRRIDVLVNNAGVAPKQRIDILEIDEESYDFVMDINLKGTFFLTQLISNVMIEGVEKDIRPIIINIGSMSAYTSSTSRGEYCISKAGISMITKLFADRLAQYNINVYEVRPGIIFTDMTSMVKEKYDDLIDNGLTPIKRWGYPQDIANAVSVFASGKLSFSTGEVVNVDGGFHLRRL